MWKAKQLVPATEYLRWATHYEQEMKATTPERWYLARVSMEIAALRWVVAHLFDEQAVPPAFAAKDFLIEFDAAVEPTEPINVEDLVVSSPGGALKVIKQQEQQIRDMVSKTMWFAAAGLDPRTGKRPARELLQNHHAAPGGRKPVPPDYKRGRP